MKENDKIENKTGAPDQNSGADPMHQQHEVAPRNSVDGCRSATDNGRLTTDNCRLITGDASHSSALPVKPPRKPRAKYRHRNHRRTGKVARLPAVIRHEIGLRFMRYEEYKDIIGWLVSQGHPGISESNLSRWRKGGFQDWLRREQAKRLDLIDVALEVLEALVASEQKNLGQSDASPSSRNPSTSSLPNLLGGGPESTLNT